MESTRTMFPLNELPEDTQGEVRSHLAVLPTRDLLNARQLSKKFLKDATTALFYKKNKSALFAQSVLLKQAFNNNANLQMFSLKLLDLSLRDVPHSLVEQGNILSLLGKRLGVDLDFLPLQDKHTNIDDIYMLTWDGRNLVHLYMQLDIGLNGQNVWRYVDYIMARMQEKDGRDYFEVIRMLHIAISKLDNLQLLIYLEKIRTLQYAYLTSNYGRSHKGKYWNEESLKLLRPILKDIAKRLDTETISSYIKIMMSELSANINLLILEFFADKIDDKVVANILLTLSFDLKSEYVDANRTALLLNVYAAFAKAGKLKKNLKEYLDVVINKCCHQSVSVIAEEAALHAAQALANEVDVAVIDEYLSCCSEHGNVFAIYHLHAIVARLTPQQLTAYLPVVTDCLEKRVHVVAAFAVIKAGMEKIASPDMCQLVDRANIYFGYYESPGYMQLADDWFLGCEESFAPNVRENCRFALIKSLNQQIKAANKLPAEHQNKDIAMMTINERLQRLAPLFRSQEAIAYLPVAIIYLKSCSDISLFRRQIAPLQAIISRMTLDDIMHEYKNIIEAIPQCCVNAPEAMSLLSYFVVNDICSLVDLGGMKSLTKLYPDYSLPLLKIMAEWRQAIDAAQIINKPRFGF